MANKEKVEIKRSDQFQEVDDELTRAMADLDSTIERVSMIFQADTEPGLLDSAPKIDIGAENAATGADKGDTAAAEADAQPQEDEQ